MPVNPSSPRRGRPPKTSDQHERLRRRVLRATAATYAEFGFRGSTVARIAGRAEVSKPTFYTCFPSAEAALEAVVTDASARLVEHLRPIAAAATDVQAGLAAGITAYLDWADQVGDGLRVFHAEQHDPASPAGRLRAQATGWLRDLLRRAVTGSGRPAPSPQALDLLLGGLQLGCYQYQQDPGRDRDASHAAMLRLATALLGTALPDITPAGTDQPGTVGADLRDPHRSESDSRSVPGVAGDQ
ncbi:TetR/AcrR family transcriptional regulator [Kibdelosporangium phytohabitans]|nr:TetR/AcrR family transcriptional regulator [Kibdelosporangium phytohabitans]MBE1461193.1 AcrR family transcriptional regulator [Kibdelosporangium phytohabitans]